MRPIPKKLKDEMESSKFYKYCCFTHGEHPEWHHHLQYRNQQINARFAILPVSKELHTESTQAVHKNPAMKELCTYLCLLRTTPEMLKTYNRRDWEQEFSYLDKKFKDDKMVEEFREWCKTWREELYR